MKVAGGATCEVRGRQKWGRTVMDRWGLVERWNQELSLLTLNETGSGILDAAAALSDHLSTRPIGYCCRPF